jgi:hypothetical protein
LGMLSRGSMARRSVSGGRALVGISRPQLAYLSPCLLSSAAGTLRTGAPGPIALMKSAAWRIGVVRIPRRGLARRESRAQFTWRKSLPCLSRYRFTCVAMYALCRCRSGPSRRPPGIRSVTCCLASMARTHAALPALAISRMGPKTAKNWSGVRLSNSRSAWTWAQKAATMSYMPSCMPRTCWTSSV